MSLSPIHDEGDAVRIASGANSNVPAPCVGVKGKGRIEPWVLAFLTFVGIACGGPGPRPEAPTGTGAIVMEATGLRVSAEAGAWSGRPRKLSDYVLPFLVVLRNTGSSQVTVGRPDFLLLDDGNRQYAPLSPAEVVTMLGGRASGVGVSPSIGVSGSSAGSTEFGVGLGIILGGSGTDTRDIVPQALPEGTVLPGAEIRGFLYFPKPASDFRSLRLVVAPRDLPGRPRLDFHFRPAGQQPN